MSLDKPFNDIGVQDLEDLIRDKVTESKTLDFKRDLYSKNDADSKEFLKDITALANTAGGHLLIGMDEEDKAAKSLDGVDLPLGQDKEELHFENLLRDHVDPRILGYRVKSFALDNGKYAMLFRIPKTFNSPHVVKFGNYWRFYTRGENQSIQMDFEQLKKDILRAATLNDKAKAFINERVWDIGYSQAEMFSKQPNWILHIIPLSALGGGITVDIRAARSALVNSGFGHSAFYNFDGVFALKQNNDESKTIEEHTMFYRNGIMEHVHKLGSNTAIAKQMIPSVRYEALIMHTAARAIKVYKTVMGITYPFMISLALTRVKGFHMATEKGFDESHYDVIPEQIDRDTLVSPEALLDEEINAPLFFRPLFDIIWNAAGLSGSRNFKNDGSWFGDKETNDLML